jgi:hypothetical protein
MTDGRGNGRRHGGERSSVGVHSDERGGNDMRLGD